MAVAKAAGLDDGNGGQRGFGDVFVELVGVLDVGFAQVLVGHDVGGVLEGIADVAVLVVGIGFAGVHQIAAPMFAIVFEGDVLLHEGVANVADGSRRNGEGSQRRGNHVPRARVAGIVIV